MTEEEWLASADPAAMLAFVRGATTTWRTRWVGRVTARRFPISERKLRLALCACCARVAHLLPAEEARECLRVSERNALGLATQEELDEAIARSMIACAPVGEEPAGRTAAFAVRALAHMHRTEEQEWADVFSMAAQAWVEAVIGQRASAERSLSWVRAEHRAECVRQAELLRDVFGNPFQPVRLDPAWLRCNDGAVERIAEAIHADRAYDDLPVLGDALEEAGCHDAQILGHCHGPGPHVPGCWVVDLVRGAG